MWTSILRVAGVGNWSVPTGDSMAPPGEVPMVGLMLLPRLRVRSLRAIRVSTPNYGRR
jgi:hypothetical protein